ncbi:TetR/AcrR family transcriptional regulator [Mesorhizobium sp. SP-1A]|uniref:TetR/AcrR family transcriptional regulator n=1 Tax=Mesorhizobium sp. SP-1A TaxID=3077840 RepID=UPI0028F6DE91|nr:TetR family transcriptional regulator [Mesorhizobium sp. SP-1A]
MTRERIVRALVDLLEKEEIDQVSMAALARAANVAERTIFRYFPTRADLVAAAGEWISTNIFRLIPSKVPEDLPRGFRDACALFDGHPRLARAIATSRVGRSARSEFRKQFIASSSEVIAPLMAGLDDREQRRAEAIVAYLDNVLAWHTLREEFGMSGSEVADTVQWALKLIFEDLRRRASAAHSSGED